MRILSIKGITGLVLGSFVLVSISTIGLAQTKAGKSAKAAKKTEEKGPANPVKPTAQSVEAGQDLYKKNCVPCHGTDAKGDGPVAKNMNPKPADLTVSKLAHGSTDGEIFTNIKDGIGQAPQKMKAFGNKLSDQDIWNIVNYIRSLQKKS